MLLDYQKMARISSGEEKINNFAIAESQTLNSFLESASAHLAQENLEEFMKRIDEQEKIIHTQHKTINEIKGML